MQGAGTGRGPRRQAGKVGVVLEGPWHPPERRTGHKVKEGKFLSMQKSMQTSGDTWAIQPKGLRKQ